jgi:hypothetical protein
MSYSDVIRAAIREHERYNGWTNYATWRVNLEIFDGWQVDAPMDGDAAREMVEEIIESTTPEGVARDYALAFLSDVNWREIADHVNEANDLTADADA